MSDTLDDPGPVDLSEVRAALRKRLKVCDDMVERSLIEDFLTPHIMAVEDGDDADPDDPHHAVVLLERVEELALELKEWVLETFPGARRRRPG